MQSPRTQPPRAAARGFTLIETVVTVVIIALLASILLVGISRALGYARSSAERQLVTSLKIAVVQFKEEFKFLPPLVQDETPNGLAAGGDGSQGPVQKKLRGGTSVLQPVTYGGSWADARATAEEAYLNGYKTANPTAAPGDESDRLDPDRRYSVYSLQYYLMGMLDISDNSPNAKPVDGAKGAQFTKVREDGLFEQRGKAYEAFFDASKDPKRLVTENTGPNSEVRFVMNDRWLHPIRYYRWKPRPAVGGNQAVNLVPRSVGDPRTNPELRDAEFAIVSIGADGLTDDGKPIRVGVKPGDADSPNNVSPSIIDNIVEVGR